MAKAESPIDLSPVHELSELAEGVVESVCRDLERLVPGIEVEHVGATALPDGLTNGDVDVNVRVSAEEFEDVVAVLSMHVEKAQTGNWTATYASFTKPDHELPVGIQVSVEGSADDFLVPLRERFRADASLRRRYDEVKQRAAPAGRTAYWRAKDGFLRTILG